MIEEIRKHKPDGATHWRHGIYFKKVNPVEWYYWEERKWKFTSHVNNKTLEMTPL